MLFTILLQKLFQARPRYQKQRRHENNHKTNPPNWRGTSYFGRTVHTHARFHRKGERATSEFLFQNVFHRQIRRESSTENNGTSYGLRFILKDVLCI